MEETALSPSHPPPPKVAGLGSPFLNSENLGVSSYLWQVVGVVGGGG